jgi:hypothetical protein
MEQNRTPQNKTTWLQLPKFSESHQKHILEKSISSTNGSGKTGYSHVED